MKYTGFNKTELPGVAIDLILMGGQSFCWQKLDKDHYIGIDKNGLMEIKYDGQNLYWQTFPEKDNFKKISEYFRLGLDESFIHKLILQDKYVAVAFSKLKNIRLLKQDFEIAFYSFIISQNNSLAVIRHRIDKLSEKYGEKIKYKKHTYYLFPATESLKYASIEDLKKCKLGYRAEYIKAGVEHLSSQSQFLSRLEKLNINNEYEVREWLMQVKGIGNKVADCIMLYGLGYDNIFPMDLWGKRILQKYYGFKDNSSYAHMRGWVKAHFKGYAGWAGQYLFEYARNNWENGQIKKTTKKSTTSKRLSNK